MIGLASAIAGGSGDRLRAGAGIRHRIAGKFRCKLWGLRRWIRRVVSALVEDGRETEYKLSDLTTSILI
jgi:hypothetical protein